MTQFQFQFLANFSIQFLFFSILAERQHQQKMQLQLLPFVDLRLAIEFCLFPSPYFSFSLCVFFSVYLTAKCQAGVGFSFPIRSIVWPSRAQELTPFSRGGSQRKHNKINIF